MRVRSTMPVTPCIDPVEVCSDVQRCQLRSSSTHPTAATRAAKADRGARYRSGESGVEETRSDGTEPERLIGLPVHKLSTSHHIAALSAAIWCVESNWRKPKRHMGKHEFQRVNGGVAKQPVLHSHSSGHQFTGRHRLMQLIVHGACYEFPAAEHHRDC